jgi:putative ABC transport system permease protein
MNALNRKLWRELWLMKGQIFAITMVVVSGTATFIMFISTMHSLDFTRNKFYREYNFADVFVNLKRAPESLKDKIKNIKGVNQVETRVCAQAKLDIKGFTESVTARINSIPDDGDPLINRLYIRAGRLPDPSRDNEVAINETFALAHGFKLGDQFAAVINGKWKQLTITGIVLSPEFILLMKVGALTPDFKRYGALWMTRKAISKAYDMEGAFNDVILTLHQGTQLSDVVRDLDNILGQYGGFGAYGRKDQISHRLLNEEFKQLKTSSRIYPSIFICVAAFLLNIVMSRTISTQREQIGTLKAFGYQNRAVSFHYMKMVILIITPGILLGIAAGIWFGQMLGDLYMLSYRFPFLFYKLHFEVILAVVAISAASAIAGTMHSLWQAARQTPAEAMRPEAPAKYKVSLIERTGLGRILSQPSRIIVRNIERKPIKTFLTIVGIAIACSTMVCSGFFKDCIDIMVHIQFELAQKEDMTVSFVEPTSYKALYEFKRMEGISNGEAFRSVPVRFKYGHRSYKTAIIGIQPNSQLSLLLDKKLKRIPIPSSGILLTDYLGKILGVQPGDMVTVETLEGSKAVRQVPVVALPKQYLGVMGYMDMKALNRLMHEGDAISGVYLVVDKKYREKIFRSFVEMPRVAEIIVRKNEIRNFYDVMAKAMLFFTFIATMMACSIAFGVIYNSARISLAERSRELSSLRVLGYTRGEIAYILLGELGFITLVAIPPGFVIGYSICVYIAYALSNDLYRVPMVVELYTFAQAAAVVLGSAFISGLIVRHKLNHLDLVEVLKTRE